MNNIWNLNFNSGNITYINKGAVALIEKYSKNRLILRELKLGNSSRSISLFFAVRLHNATAPLLVLSYLKIYKVHNYFTFLNNRAVIMKLQRRKE